MFNIGAGEMILIALVLLIAVGPEQLPGVIRRTGRIVGQLKTMSDNLRRDFNSSLDEIERAADVKSWAGPELEETVETIKEAASEPFKTDFTIDGSTKVTDLWARPPAEDPDEVAPAPDSAASGETAVDETAGDNSEQVPDEFDDPADGDETGAEGADAETDVSQVDESGRHHEVADSSDGPDATDEVA